jgi:hypothetical protein
MLNRSGLFSKFCFAQFFDKENVSIFEKKDETRLIQLSEAQLGI